MGHDIDILIKESIRLLREMIANPSPSFEEDEVKNLLCSRLDEMGVSYIVLNNNVIAFSKHFSPEKRTLMLCAHIDTVPPAEDYDFDPYNPDYKEDIIAGLGSNDDGASVVSLLAAFRYYHETELPINLMLVLSAEEERSGKRGMDLVWKVLQTSGIG
ncbi:MAG: M20/M25/M40 family metallo-hydrolase, partial [Bacteroidales bacterium]|nr:M20/M25/M40 family metallo-hydrolase [Bacteroidales bacterium]